MIQIRSWLISLAFVSLAGTLTAQQRVVKYGDGKKDDHRSTAGQGHAVLFDRPVDGFAATTVEIHGSRYGGRYDPYLAVARVSVCDAELSVLAQSFVLYTEWKPGRFGWVNVPIPPVGVPERFFALIEFFPTATKGIYMGIDEASSGHSYSATPGKIGRKLGQGEWMIRVHGSTKAKLPEVPDVQTANELASGEGEQKNKRSTAGVGHAVRFRTKDKARLLTKIALHGSRYGGGYRAESTFFHVFVCDKRLKVLARSAHPYSIFDPGPETWREIELPPTRVPTDFYVLVHFEPTAQRGVYVGLWKEKKAASLSAYPGTRGQKIDKGLGWMIKATLCAPSGKAKVGKPRPSAAHKGPDALALAELHEKIDAREKVDDVRGANALIEGFAKKWPEAAPELGRFDESEHFLLKRVGMPDEYADALLRLMEAAHEALTTRFGFERVSAVPGRKIHLHVLLGQGKDVTLFTRPSHPDYSLIVFRGDRRRGALNAPTRGGPHNVYGFCHELGHVLLGWEDSRHKWAHYLGSMLLDDVKKKLGDRAWGDPYDYVKIEGMPRFQREIRDATPGVDSDEGVARLFHEVGQRFGTEVWGPAFRWIRKNREGKAFSGVRLYALADLKAALLALGKERARVEELFGG